MSEYKENDSNIFQGHVYTHILFSMGMSILGTMTVDTSGPRKYCLGLRSYNLIFFFSLPYFFNELKRTLLVRFFSSACFYFLEFSLARCSASHRPSQVVQPACDFLKTNLTLGSTSELGSCDMRLRKFKNVVE